MHISKIGQVINIYASACPIWSSDSFTETVQPLGWERWMLLEAIRITEIQTAGIRNKPRAYTFIISNFSSVSP
jgi:hypothetical protein